MAIFTSRRQFLITSALGLCSSRMLFAQTGEQPRSMEWHDVRDWGVEGKGWNDTTKYYDRFPQRAEPNIPPQVWHYSRHSAGMLTRFRTDAAEIWVDYAVTSPNLSGPHIPATTMSGVDLYAEDDAGDWHWMAVTRPLSHQIRTQIAKRILPGERGYSLYLPNYNGTEFLKIGVPAGSRFEPIPPRTEKPILFYGTSITQGASSSRAGMPHPSILGRRLKKPILNLGFAGAGRMEQAVGELLAEQDPAIYVVDCLPNMNPAMIGERAVPFIHLLRKARPDTPILLVEDRTYANARFLLDHREQNDSNRLALQTAFQQLQQEGVKGLFYLDGESLLGEDREDTSDGSHPSDLGFFRQANALEPILRNAIASITPTDAKS